MLGHTISHYRITGKLGSGGMGIVYAAEDVRLSRKVALKFLPEESADDPDAERRFQREADTIAQLNHPNICTIYEIDRSRGTGVHRDGVRGRRQSQDLHVAPHGYPRREIVDIALQITAALGAAHAKGIVHRDIKPGNIIVAADGHVKVLDFGLARRFKTDETHELGPDGSTILGRPMGTANYMAPERILQLPLDPRSDFFSLGVVMYEMATGRLPFAAVSPSETVTNVLEKNQVPLKSVAPQHPKSLEQVVQRLLAKRAGDRFGTAAELTRALEAIEGTNQPLGERLRRLFRRP